MSKERVEEVKRLVLNGDWNGKVFKSDWLKIIEQAEDAWFYESKMKNAYDCVDMFEEYNQELEQQNDCYRKHVKQALDILNDNPINVFDLMNAKSILKKVLEDDQ